MRLRPRGALSLCLVASGALVGGLLARGRPAPVSDAAGTLPPLVRVAPAEPRDVAVVVHTHGSVEPRTESELVAEVSGRALRLSPALVAGGFFEADELLLELERADYENAVRRARARLARAESELHLARADLERKQALALRRVASDAVVDAARSAEQVAHAAREEAAAALEQAERDLERTHLLAPFAGRVRSVAIDVGQFVARGTPVARLYAVDFAEVRLPVRDDDLAFLDVPIGYRDAAAATEGPPVRLRGRFAGAQHEWPGRVVRVEGEIDERSRMLHLVARVEDPYGRRDGRPPLPVGLFVEAEIEGIVLEDVLAVPRDVVRDDGLLVVDVDDRLRLRSAEVVRLEGERALVRAALEPGDRLCLSPLETPVAGMRVRTFGAEPGVPALALAPARP